MSAYLDIEAPASGRYRTCAIQFGVKPWFTFEAWLDTGYDASLFEYRCGVSVGPWDFTFDWRPAAREQEKRS